MQLDEPRRAGGFATTQWSLVLAAGDRGSPRFREALADLCAAYWHPVYAFVRRRGTSPEDAQDLTQGFFSVLLEKNSLAAVRRERGRFRSFLLTACKHYLTNEWDRTRAAKRGGGVSVVSFDAEAAESGYLAEAPGHSPERLFQRRWACTLLERTGMRLRDELARSRHAERSLRLSEFLTGDGADVPYRDVAGELQMTEGAVKTAVHRQRRRFGELLREEVARTVEGPEGIDDEIRFLFSAIEP